MYISFDELREINKVQVEILRKVADVCKKINIKFFVVHGSLLGAIRTGGFIPFDDDIDIAMKRGDYEKFLRDAPVLLGEELFLQSNISDENYPLQFAKVRDCRTTYICEAVKKINMNHGVYIDVFPIDFVREKAVKVEAVKMKIINLRIAASLYRPDVSILQKFKGAISCIILPSIKKAIKMRERLLQSISHGDWVCMTGGKPSEARIPAEWFSETITARFEEVEVYIPVKYDAYLRHIYGDYETCTLVEGKMREGKVKLNATVVDMEKPYTDYM